MMRPFTVPAALAALAMGVPVALLQGSPAAAAAVFVEVNPSTAPAGHRVALRASCTDNLASATVTSAAFTTAVTVAPTYGFLTASVTVPAGTRPADYPVRLHCPGGATATATLHVVAGDAPRRGPATGGGGTAPRSAAPVLLGGGLTALAGGAVLGVVTLRRRHRP